MCPRQLHKWRHWRLLWRSCAQETVPMASELILTSDEWLCMDQPAPTAQSMWPAKFQRTPKTNLAECAAIFGAWFSFSFLWRFLSPVQRMFLVMSSWWKVFNRKKCDHDVVFLCCSVCLCCVSLLQCLSAVIHRWLLSNVNGHILKRIESNWSRLKLIESNWSRLKPIEADWSRLNPIESNWSRLKPIEADWSKKKAIEICRKHESVVITCEKLRILNLWFMNSIAISAPACFSGVLASLNLRSPGASPLRPRIFFGEVPGELSSKDFYFANTSKYYIAVANSIFLILFLTFF